MQLFLRLLLAASMLVVLLSFDAEAQKRTEEKVTVSFTQLPLTPFPASVKTYAQEVIYQSGNISQSVSHESILAHAQIPGYELTPLAEQADVKVKVYLGSYAMQKKEYMQDDTRSAGDVAGSVATVWTYEITQKYPLKLKVETAAGEVLYEEYINNSNEFMPKKFDKKFPSKESLDYYWHHSAKAALKGMEDALIKSQLATMKTMLENKYGYKKASASFELHSFESKKEDYSDLEGALKAAFKGYSLYSKDSIADASLHLQDAVTGWEAALATYDPSSKKARIDEKVALSLHYNCMMAYLWLQDFTAAKQHLAEAEKIRQYNSLTGQWKKFLQEQELRAKANHSTKG